jgi:phenylacetate-coenzyme A ligase PaaK-like adenylate-forming protein
MDYFMKLSDPKFTPSFKKNTIGENLNLIWQMPLELIQAYQQKAILRKSPQEILSLQQKRLRSMVKWAKEKSPFYAEHFKNVNPARFELRELPTVSKTVMMTNFDRFLTDRRLQLADLENFMDQPQNLGQWHLGRYVASRSSGTQGMKAVVVHDRQMMLLLYQLKMTRGGTTFSSTPWGILKRFVRRPRWAIVTMQPTFNPSGTLINYGFSWIDFVVKRKWLTHISPLEHIVSELNHFEPNILMAYTHDLETLAWEEKNARLQLSKKGTLQQIINISEPLSEKTKKLLEDSFGKVSISNDYSMGECMALTIGCPQGHGMHLQTDWAILEVVDRNNRPVPDGEPGEKVLLTNLYNTIQPFIRYEIDDIVTMSPNPCPCGSPFPLVSSVKGRADEVLWIKIGNRYSQIHPMLFEFCLLDYSDIALYQVIQTQRNRLLLRAKPAPGRQIILQDLDRAIQSGLRRFRLVDLVRINIEITNQLGPDPRTGKFKRIVSLVGAPSENEDGGGASDELLQPAVKVS